MRSRLKSRIHDQPVFLGTNEVSGNGVDWTTVSPSYYYNSSRVYSGLAGCRDYTHPGPPYKSGGPLDVIHYFDPGLDLRRHGVYYGYQGSRPATRYTGGFVCNWWPSGGDGEPPFTKDNLRKEAESFNSPLMDYWSVFPYGATGWRMYAPGKPSAGASVFLAELRELPSLLKDTAKAFHESWRAAGGSLRGFFPKKAADKWLAANFGWLPFVSDLRKFHRTTQRIGNIFQYMYNNNGRWVHRGGIVVDDSDNRVVTQNAVSTAHRPILPSYCYKGPYSGNYVVSRKLTRKIWFEGRFRFYIPDIGSAEWGKRATRHIYGATISPSTVWELVPWSWLYDWSSNAGDVIANMDTGWAENLVAKYAYIMGTHEYEYTVTSMLNLLTGPVYDQWVFPVTRKSRWEAYPFGFSLTAPNLSARQWSILAALGVKLS